MLGPHADSCRPQVSLAWARRSMARARRRGSGQITNQPRPADQRFRYATPTGAPLSADHRAIPIPVSQERSGTVRWSAGVAQLAAHPPC